MTTKRSPAGSVSTADSGSIRRNMACTHGPQARKRSATAWSVIDSYNTVKVPATSRKGLSKPQYKRTMRKSCSGVRTFLARTKALNSRAMGAVSGGRSCKRSSKSVSGSVRGNCMGCFSCRGEGQMFPPCSMPLFSMTYSLSWRIWGSRRRLPPRAATVGDVGIDASVERHDPLHRAHREIGFAPQTPDAKAAGIGMAFLQVIDCHHQWQPDRAHGRGGCPAL